MFNPMFNMFHWYKNTYPFSFGTKLPSFSKLVTHPPSNQPPSVSRPLICQPWSWLKSLQQTRLGPWHKDDRRLQVKKIHPKRNGSKLVSTFRAAYRLIIICRDVCVPMTDQWKIQILTRKNEYIKLTNSFTPDGNTRQYLQP